MRCPEHLKWIRGLLCSVPDCTGITIQAHHVRTAANSGTSIKPGDEWAVPLCASHHNELHDKGRKFFAHKYGVNLEIKAAEMAEQSPFLKNFTEDS
jgi:hypothetical protein